MMTVKWTTKHWIVLSSVLLVLVVLGSAYSVYVPQLREYRALQDDLRIALAARDEMLSRDVAPVVDEAAKAAIAEAVPAVLDQARFLKRVRAEEKEAGVTIKSLLFDAQQEAVEAKAAADAKAGQPTKNGQKSVLHEQIGMLSVEGNYEQVRSFLEGFASLPRLVTFQKWEFSAESANVEEVVERPLTTADLSSRVKMNISFKIYLSPGSEDLLPAAEPLKTYPPAERTNSVDSW